MRIHKLSLSKTAFIAAVIFFSFLPRAAWSLVVLDAHANSACGTDASDTACGGGGTTLTYSLTVGSGASRALAVFVEVSSNGATAPPAVSSVTFNGVALGQTTTVSLPGATYGYASLYALPAGTQPASGAHNIIVTIASALGTEMAIHSGAISALGVNQTTTFTSFATNTAASGTSATVTLGSSGSGDLVVSAICSGTNETSAPQGSLWINSPSNSMSCDSDGGATAFGGTTSLSWTISNDQWATVAASFKDAGLPLCCQSQFNSIYSTANAHTVVVNFMATAAGSLLVVGTGNNSTRTVTGVSDGTNAFTQATNAHGVNSNYETDIWYLLKSTSGKTSVTITFSGASGTWEKDGWFWEVRGFRKPLFDLGNQVNAGVQAGGIATGAAVTTTGTRGFVVGVDMSSAFVTADPVPGNEFIAGGFLLSSGNAACSAFTTTAGSHQPAWTDNGGSFVSSTAAFKDVPLHQSSSY